MSKFKTETVQNTLMRGDIRIGPSRVGLAHNHRTNSAEFFKEDLQPILFDPLGEILYINEDRYSILPVHP